MQVGSVWKPLGGWQQPAQDAWQSGVMGRTHCELRQRRPLPQARQAVPFVPHSSSSVPGTQVRASAQQPVQLVNPQNSIGVETQPPARHS